MSELVLIHRQNKEPLSLDGTPVWRTCLRQIGLTTASEFTLDTHALDEVLWEEEAIAFLVEILCGLHSPNLGETEVFGQFKIFLTQLPQDHILLTRSGLLQMILHTVKEIRHRHLTDCGAYSYGQLMRRSLKPFSKVNIWGYGQLGQEVGRCLEDKQLSFVVRNPQKFVDAAHAFYWSTNMPESPAHVIAAPFSDETVISLAQRPSTEIIYDLRGESNLQIPKLVPLQTILAEAKRLKQEQAKIIPACREQILERCKKYFLSAQHRPFGWEDLCC